MRNKTKLPFNPETMTVSDLKRCAHTLRSLMHAYQTVADHPLMTEQEQMEWLGSCVVQCADAYEVE